MVDHKEQQIAIYLIYRSFKHISDFRKLSKF
jgi:hypothetical protein